MTKIIRHSAMIAMTVIFFAGFVAAQDNDAGNEGRPSADQPQDNRGTMLRQLGLTRQQIQRVRRINTERKPHMDNAQMRLRLATRALDDAIYADQVDDTMVQERLKQMQLAQAEVFKVRTMSELAIRRLLTPEQLVRFRNLRQRFEQNRIKAKDRAALGVEKPQRDNAQLLSRAASLPDR